MRLRAGFCRASGSLDHEYRLALAASALAFSGITPLSRSALCPSFPGAATARWFLSRLQVKGGAGSVSSPDQADCSRLTSATSFQLGGWSSPTFSVSASTYDPDLRTGLSSQGRVGFFWRRSQERGRLNRRKRCNRSYDCCLSERIFLLTYYICIYFLISMIHSKGKTRKKVKDRIKFRVSGSTSDIAELTGLCLA